MSTANSSKRLLEQFDDQAKPRLLNFSSNGEHCFDSLKFLKGDGRSGCPWDFISGIKWFKENLSIWVYDWDWENLMIEEFRIGGHKMQQSWGNPSSLVSCEIFDQVCNPLSWKGGCFPRQSTVWPYLVFINFLKQAVKLFVGVKYFSFLANVSRKKLSTVCFQSWDLKQVEVNGLSFQAPCPRDVTSRVTAFIACLWNHHSNLPGLS